MDDDKLIAQAARRAAAVQGLRDLATFLEAHPNVPMPSYNVLNVFVHDRDEVVRIARAASWEKVYNDTWFSLRKTFGDDVTLDINTSRETVCRRVVVGTKIVETQPAHEVDVVEWVCEDGSLLAGRS